VLQLQRVGRNDHFFRLGGHSLLAVRAVARLRRAGIESAISDLFNYPTVKLFAAVAGTPHARSANDGALLIRDGEETPIFLLHDGYGDELYFSALAQHLPKGWPVYGLPSARRSEVELNTMSAMAERMIGLMRRVQPDGPYRLAGWSFGGVLAYEVSQQLIDSGEEVVFLGLMDSWCPDGNDSESRRERTVESVLMELCESQKIEELRETETAFEELFERCRALGALPANFEGLSEREAHEQCRNLVVHLGAMESYRPRKIAIPVHLFVASDRPPEWPAVTAALGWEKHVPEELLYTYAMPGSHQSMMRPPHIIELGRRIAESVAAAVGVRV
jgi:arthrofactin-type cyclic lipopeptide synthetase C